MSVLAEGTNMDSAVFVYHVGKTDDPIPGDKFECVASVNQMFEIPKNQGVSLTIETGIPYYRSNVLDVVVRSAEELERVWEEVKKEVHWLIKNMNAADRMRGTMFAEITDDLVTESVFEMTPPIRKQLSYHPAGTATYVGGVQGITSPDSSLDGWLPISVAPATIVVPFGAAFYYNIGQDASLQEVWPPKEPFSGNQLFRNGILMPYGVVWTMSKDTIFWHEFDPANIPGYTRLSGQDEDGNAPWPISYVSRTNPGDVSPQIVLTLFK